MQPLAGSKELLPAGGRMENGLECPRAVSEYLVERLISAGASRLCFVISPSKTDIMHYYGSREWGVDIVYAIQPQPLGLCDAIFRAAPVIHEDEQVVIGLPDTIWFPEDALTRLPQDALSLLLFPVEHPECFDAVVTDSDGAVQEIQVKTVAARSHWIWGAMRMPSETFHSLHAMWRTPQRRDEYLGTLINAWLARGGTAVGVRAGRKYIDAGTLEGYRDAIRSLSSEDHGSGRDNATLPREEENVDVFSSSGR
jgi:glucose-1-phosphate thymidylyltransferase